MMSHDFVGSIKLERVSESVSCFYIDDLDHFCQSLNRNAAGIQENGTGVKNEGIA
jgi:hypothetical protein